MAFQAVDLETNNIMKLPTPLRSNMRAHHAHAPLDGPRDWVCACAALCAGTCAGMMTSVHRAREGAGCGGGGRGGGETVAAAPPARVRVLGWWWSMVDEVAHAVFITFATTRRILRANSVAPVQAQPRDNEANGLALWPLAQQTTYWSSNLRIHVR